MFEQQRALLIRANSATGKKGRLEQQAITQADNLYHQASLSAWFSQFFHRLTKRESHLQDLGRIVTRRTVAGRYLGARAVPIHKIKGSESRSEDFDTSFRPLNPRNHQRWLNIAIVRLLGVDLPPVELIQIGEDYFVRDGHHRISVARTLGQKYIDGLVTVWEVAGAPHVSCAVRLDVENAAV